MNCDKCGCIIPEGWDHCPACEADSVGNLLFAKAVDDTEPDKDNELRFQFITAQEAYEMATSYENKIIKGILRDINRKIRERASQGYCNCYMSNNSYDTTDIIRDVITKYLRDQGYTVYRRNKDIEIDWNLYKF